MARRRATGIEDETFCHLLDAWVEGEMSHASDDEVDDAVESLDEFRDDKGDAFEDAAALSRAIDDWALFSGGPERHPMAHRVLADILAMWRSVEKMPRKRRR